MIRYNRCCTLTKLVISFRVELVLRITNFWEGGVLLISNLCPVLKKVSNHEDNILHSRQALCFLLYMSQMGNICWDMNFCIFTWGAAFTTGSSGRQKGYSLKNSLFISQRFSFKALCQSFSMYCVVWLTSEAKEVDCLLEMQIPGPLPTTDGKISRNGVREFTF